MATGINVKKISKSQKTFKLLLRVLILSVLVFVWITILTFIKKIELKQLNSTLLGKQEQLEEYESYSGYKKFLAVKNLEEKNLNMYWFERIEKISEIFEDLKNVDESWDWEIELSDFNVSLEELSLRGTVSSLKDLYYTNASGRIKALLERFESLDFIEKMTIKEYHRVDNWFEFVLYANVIENGGK